MASTPAIGFVAPAEQPNIDPYAPQTFPKIYDNNENLDRQNAEVIAALPGILAEEAAEDARLEAQGSSLTKLVGRVVQEDTKKMDRLLASKAASKPFTVVARRSEPAANATTTAWYAPIDTGAKKTPALNKAGLLEDSMATFRHYGDQMTLPFDEIDRVYIIPPVRPVEHDVPKFVVPPKRDEAPVKLFAHPSGFKIKLTVVIMLALVGLALFAVLMWIVYESLQNKNVSIKVK